MAGLNGFAASHSRKTSEKVAFPGSRDWRQTNKPVRRWGFRNTLFTASIAWFFVSIWPVYNQLLGGAGSSRSRSSRARAPLETVTRTVAVPHIPATPVPGVLSSNTKFDPARLPDATDTFAQFRKTENCSLSSLELHVPFEPLCMDKDSVLQAMSSGGRIGFDAPYIPRGCDMRWFSGEEICDIMARFEKIYIIGDSMARNIGVAMNVLLRADLYDGGRTTWFTDPEGVDCHCTGTFDSSKCTFNSAVSTSGVWNDDPDSIACPREGHASFEYNAITKYPIDEGDLAVLLEHIRSSKPKKPYVWIFGHGLWNDLDVTKTYAWIDYLIDRITTKAPYLVEEGAYFPRLFVAPNAAGIKKPEVFLARQGNLAITKFEHNIRPFVKDRGFDFLGTYNATVQTHNPDGTHGGMKNNLLKAQMLLNWLNNLDPSEYYR